MSRDQRNKSPKSKHKQESRKNQQTGIAKKIMAKNTQSILKNMKFLV
jgi:hypothetical protein